MKVSKFQSFKSVLPYSQRGMPRYDSENYLGLDEVGTRIWQLIDDGETMRAVVATMLVEYDTNEETLVGDPDEFLNDLQAQELIRPVG